MAHSNGSALSSLVSGLAGAAALTAAHQTARYLIPGAPRMDIVGRRAVARTVRGLGAEPPAGDKLQLTALVSDLVLNSLFYSLVGIGRAKHPMTRGTALGAAAGIGAVVLPPILRLGHRARGGTPKGKAMTFTWYLLGGLAAAAAFRALRDMDCCGTAKR